LLVGGIGVMNIMLVVRTGKNREIGIRKRWAPKRVISGRKFLIEAAFLTFTGGIIGVILGWAVPILSTSVLFPTLVTADTVILAVSVSVGIGLFLRVLPA